MGMVRPAIGADKPDAQQFRPEFVPHALGTSKNLQEQEKTGSDRCCIVMQLELHSPGKLSDAG
jgi:hypothetical protein